MAIPSYSVVVMYDKLSNGLNTALFEKTGATPDLDDELNVTIWEQALNAWRVMDEYKLTPKNIEIRYEITSDWYVELSHPTKEINHVVPRVTLTPEIPAAVAEQIERSLDSLVLKKGKDGFEHRIRNESRVYKQLLSRIPERLGAKSLWQIGTYILLTKAGSCVLGDFYDELEQKYHCIVPSKSEEQALYLIRKSAMLGHLCLGARISNMSFDGLEIEEEDIAAELKAALDRVAWEYDVVLPQNVDEIIGRFAETLKSDAVYLDCTPRNATIDLNNILDTLCSLQGIKKPETRHSRKAEDLTDLVRQNLDDSSALGIIMETIASNVNIFDFDKYGLRVQFDHNPVDFFLCYDEFLSQGYESLQRIISAMKMATLHPRAESGLLDDLSDLIDSRARDGRRTRIAVKHSLDAGEIYQAKDPDFLKYAAFTMLRWEIPFYLNQTNSEYSSNYRKSGKQKQANEKIFRLLNQAAEFIDMASHFESGDYHELTGFLRSAAEQVDVAGSREFFRENIIESAKGIVQSTSFGASDGRFSYLRILPYAQAIYNAGDIEAGIKIARWCLEEQALAALEDEYVAFQRTSSTGGFLEYARDIDFSEIPSDLEYPIVEQVYCKIPAEELINRYANRYQLFHEMFQCYFALYQKNPDIQLALQVELNNRAA